MNVRCKVCGERAAGFHFGAFTCEGCKSFFGRCCNNTSVIGECRNNQECVINKRSRTSCKACRLQKCLAVGMSKSGSRYGRRSNWFKQYFQEKERITDNTNVDINTYVSDAVSNDSNSNIRNEDNNDDSNDNSNVSNDNSNVSKKYSRGTEISNADSYHQRIEHHLNGFRVAYTVLCSNPSEDQIQNAATTENINLSSAVPSSVLSASQLKFNYNYYPCMTIDPFNINPNVMKGAAKLYDFDPRNYINQSILLDNLNYPLDLSKRNAMITKKQEIEACGSDNSFGMLDKLIQPLDLSVK